MTDLPSHVEIHEEGPARGFSDRTRPHSHRAENPPDRGAGRKPACITSRPAPSSTPASSPAGPMPRQWSRGFTAKPDVHYTGLFFNGNGLDRALAFKDKLTINRLDIIDPRPPASPRKNLNRSPSENHRGDDQAQRASSKRKACRSPASAVMAAFGCNYQGDIPPAQVISTLEDGLGIAEQTGATITLFSLADTMGWATPARIERVINEVRNRWPDMTISLHLHDTRGLAVANAHAALKLGVNQFDSTVGGPRRLARSPASPRPPATSAPRNWSCFARKWASTLASTLDALIEVGRLAEDIVGHQLPSELIHAGSLDAFPPSSRLKPAEPGRLPREGGARSVPTNGVYWTRSRLLSRGIASSRIIVLKCVVCWCASNAASSVKIS